ncbi:MAG: amidohydrolase family protein [Clostridiales bacterium]|jgi:N-acyl-D-amino-acid deacylase|nr:amidohydrolase family protein [Clostridiales bacterium]
MKTFLKNAKIYDGTGTEAFDGGVLIDGERISAVFKSAEVKGKEPEAGKVIDLKGLSLAPGFIDAHSHNDWFAVKKDPIPYFEPFIRQGITSFVAGNCGLSIIGAAHGSPHMDKVGAGLFFNDESVGEISSAKELFDAVDANSPANIAACVGHCSARTGISGYENRPLSEKELQSMIDTMDQAMSEGACGGSLGLMYEPGIYAPKEELRAVAELCAKRGKPLTVHPRACSAVSMAYSSPFGRPHILRALDELHEMSKGLNLKLHYSHAIFVGEKTFRAHEEMLQIFSQMRSGGIDLWFDIYAETMGVSVITVIAPVWWLSASEAEKAKFANRLKFKLLGQVSMILLGFTLKDMQIACLGKGLEQYEGKRVDEIAKEMKVSPLDAYIKLCGLSNNLGRVNMYRYSTPEIISKLSKHENVLYMTDAWIEKLGVQNPAAFDCFPKFLQLSLKGTGDTMPKTIRKMTGATADRFCLPERGYIKEGGFADLTVFDEKEVLDGIPDRFKAFGIKRVFINGLEVLENDDLKKDALRHAGKAMRVK